MSTGKDDRVVEEPSRPLSSVEAEELFHRAEQAFAAGLYAQAVPLYRQLLAAQHSSGVQLFRLAMIANRTGDYGDAWRWHRQALAADPALAARISPATAPHHEIVCRSHYDTEDVSLCPLCGGKEQLPLQIVNCLPLHHYHAAFDPIRRWVRCPTCDHGFANPRPSDLALQQAFQDPPPAHLLQWNYGRLTVVADIVHELWRRHPGGDFLDVGVGDGALAGVALDYGYRVCGLDLHPAYAPAVQRLGVEFLHGDVASYDFAGRQFDVITMGDVIEHVVGPRAVLARVVALLKPKGLLWLSTPNYRGAWTRMLADQDPMWMEGEHLHYFSQGSLQRLLAEQGLHILDHQLSKRFMGCLEVLSQRNTLVG